MEARFSLIDTLVDDVECQLLILMHEQGLDLPRYSRYVFRNREGGGSSGTLGHFTGRAERLEAAGQRAVQGCPSQSK